MQTFLRCKKTGHVTWTTHGYVFWSHAPSAGGTTTKSKPSPTIGKCCTSKRQRRKNASYTGPERHQGFSMNG
jgi:hypothetical protein